MMYVILLGVGFADSTTSADAYLNYGAIFSFAGLQNSTEGQSSDIDFTQNNVQDLINVSAAPDGAKYASIMNRISCAYYQVIQDKIINYPDYNTSIANDALTTVFPNAQSVTFNDVISISTTSNPMQVTINFGNYSSADSTEGSAQCGSITWKVPSGQSASDFTSTPIYLMLQTLYQQTGRIFANVNQFYMNGFKTQSENDYYQCLTGANIMYDGLIMYTDASGKELYRPFGRICEYDASTTDRQNNLTEFVNDLSPYTMDNQVNWVEGCSGNCLGQFDAQFIDSVAGVISASGIDVKKQMSTQQLQSFTFGNGAGAIDPTNWVINTGNSQFGQAYIGDLLVLVQDYKLLNWSLQEQGGANNLYSSLITPAPPPPPSAKPIDLSSSMNSNSLNLLTQSMLAPFFGSNPVDFFSFPGKILTWRNLAISASNFTTSLMMIMQRMSGFHYYDPGTVMTLSWYASEGKNKHPSVSSLCQSTYQQNCMGTAISNCYSAMNSAGCFMNEDGVGRGLLGTSALMYNVGSDQQNSSIVIYNPLADYIEIGYTVLTAATYYLYKNNMAVIELYIELAAMKTGINGVFGYAKGVILQWTKPNIPPWCPRFCQNLIVTAIDTPKMLTDYFIQTDQDRIGFYNNLGTTFMVLFIPFGAILTILLPLYPTVIFLVGMFGLVSCRSFNRWPDGCRGVMSS